MTIEDKPIRRPFGEDYPDLRDDAQRDCDRRAVARQVKSLGTPEEEDPYHAALLRRLRRRREGRADAEELLQFEIVPDGRRSLLVASGELVLRREELDDAVLGLLDAWDFGERRDLPGHCEALAGRVARFVSPGIALADLLAVRQELRSKGVRADVDHITPLAGVVKGKGGPENTDGKAEFGALAWESRGRVAVAVLDTGIAEERRSDGWLAHDVIERRDDNIDVLDAFPDDEEGARLDFATGHGTFVTGVVQQVCPEADVRVYRAADSDGIGTEIELGCALIRAAREGAQVVNISLGTRTLDDGPPVALEAALEVLAEVEAEQQREVLVVAAAGNFGDTRPCWPAAFRRVVAVAGLTARGRPAPDWSSHGPWVDCSTVGEGVVSTYLAGTESKVFDPEPDTFGENAWAVWTGTSFAAPQIAGAVARRSSEMGLAPREALTSLLAEGVTLPGFGRALRFLPGS